MFLLFTNGRQKPHGVKGLALGGRAEVGTEKKIFVTVNFLLNYLNNLQQKCSTFLDIFMRCLFVCWCYNRCCGPHSDREYLQRQEDRLQISLCDGESSSTGVMLMTPYQSGVIVY